MYREGTPIPELPLMTRNGMREIVSVRPLSIPFERVGHDLIRVPYWRGRPANADVTAVSKIHPVATELLFNIKLKGALVADRFSRTDLAFRGRFTP